MKRYFIKVSGLSVLIGLALGLIVLYSVPLIAQSNEPDEAGVPTLIVGNFSGTLRSGPSPDATTIKDIAGQEVPITGITADGGYYRVVSEGQEGWISDINVLRVNGDVNRVPVVSDGEVTAAEVEGPTLIVGSFSGALRSGPSPDATTIKDIAGQEVPITGITADGSYYRVISEGQEGWISDINIQSVKGDLNNVPVIGSPEPCKVSTDKERFASVRVGPGTNRTAILFLPANEEFSVLGEAEADDGSPWWKLDKDEVAPDSAATELWVAQDQVTATVGCTTVAEADAPGIIPIVISSPEEASDDQSTGTVVIPADGRVVTSSFALEAGVTYEVIVSGTYRYDTGEPGEFADAQFREDDDDQWSIRLDMVEINRQLRTADVSSLAKHTYTYYVIGQGAPITLRIFDSFFGQTPPEGVVSPYEDNAGSLTVTIRLRS